MHRYVLIDASARPDTPQALHFHARELSHRPLFERQPEANHADLGPWLVQLPDVDEAPIEIWLRTLEHGHPTVAWLLSEHGFDPVFAHLEAHLDLRRANGKLALLRYWDSRVFFRLHQVLTREQRLQLLGPIERWHVRLLGSDFVVDRPSLQQQEAA